MLFFFKESVWYDRPIANGDIKREKEAQNYWTETKQVHKMCNKRNWSTVTPERKMSYEIIFFIDIKGIFFFKTVIIFKTASLVVSEDDEMLVMSYECYQHFFERPEMTTCFSFFF